MDACDDSRAVPTMKPSWVYLTDKEILDLAEKNLCGLVAPELLRCLHRRDLVGLLSAECACRQQSASGSSCMSPCEVQAPISEEQNNAAPVQQQAEISAYCKEQKKCESQLASSYPHSHDDNSSLAGHCLQSSCSESISTCGNGQQQRKPRRRLSKGGSQIHHDSHVHSSCAHDQKENSSLVGHCLQVSCGESPSVPGNYSQNKQMRMLKYGPQFADKWTCGHFAFQSKTCDLIMLQHVQNVPLWLFMLLSVWAGCWPQCSKLPLLDIDSGRVEVGFNIS